MTHDRFNKLLHETVIPELIRKLTVKSVEYSRDGDKLSNFVRAGAAQGTTPQQALRGMQIKHIVSLQDFVNDRACGRIHPLDLWKEKVTDDMAYDALLLAQEVEAQELEELGNDIEE